MFLANEVFVGVQVQKAKSSFVTLSAALVAVMLIAATPPITTTATHAVTTTADSTVTTRVATLSAMPSVQLAGGDLGSSTTQVSAVLTAPFTFSALGFRAPLKAQQLRVRTATTPGAFGPWHEVDFYGEEDGPDRSTDEQMSTTHQHAELLWVSDAKYLQLSVAGVDVSSVEIVAIDSLGLSTGVTAGLASTTPLEGGMTHEATLTATPFIPGFDVVGPASGNVSLITRAQWGADESLGSAEVTIADTIHMGIVHHTAHRSAANGANTYTAEEAPGIIRAMHIYHTRPSRQGGLGWKDLGYNVVVDRFGRVYEGRRGGFDQAVIGAHARGFNTGSFGVAVIGDFSDVLPSKEAIAALTNVIATKSQIHGIDPDGFTNQMPMAHNDETTSTASLATTGVLRPVIVGHRDVGSTVCPGLILNLLPEMRLSARAVSVRFPDVPANSPHRPSIVRLADQGVIRGCRDNAFCPSQGLTRAQAATFVLQALQLPVVPPSRAPFTDVALTAPHASSIYTLVENGFMMGKQNNRFGPSDRMTRAQLAILLYNASGNPSHTVTTDPYPDVSRDAVHASGIAGLKDLGIVGNCGAGNFCPNTIVLRDSTASFADMLRTVTGRNATVADTTFTTP